MKITQNNQNFQSRKIPRYIYHLTSNENYNSMLKDGFINKEGMPRLYIEKGIYTLELSNFFKFWGKNKDWGYDNLQSMILRHIVKWIATSEPEKSKLVILKIPTSKLDTQKLSIRSLNKLFNFVDNHDYIIEASEELQTHLKGKTPATEAPLYKMRKEAIEYIYNENIPMKNVEQIGNIVNIPSLRKNPKFILNPAKFIMQALLSGTPEFKALKELN